MGSQRFTCEHWHGAYEGRAKVHDHMNRKYITVAIDSDMAEAITDMLNERYTIPEDDGVYFVEFSGVKWVLFVKAGIVYDEDGKVFNAGISIIKGSARIGDLPNDWKVSE